MTRLMPATMPTLSRPMTVMTKRLDVMLFPLLSDMREIKTA
jgi:hypothetical protein